MGRLATRHFVAVLMVGALVAGSCGGGEDPGQTLGSTTSSSTSSTTSTTTTVTTTIPTTTTIPNTTTSTVPAPTGPDESAFTRREVTFVDETRGTPAGAATEAADQRVLEVWLYLPDASEPAPLIVFSHGISGHPRKFEELHSAWAESGYAVAAPVFPLTADTVEGSGGNLGDIPNQPGDVTFVLDRLLTDASAGDVDLTGRFDPDAVAAAGLSAGAITTYTVAVDDTTRDPRFRAAVVMAGLVGNEFEAAEGLPVMAFHGELDSTIPLAAGESAFAALAPPRHFVVMLGGGHSDPFEDEDDNPGGVEGHAALLAAGTVAFWDQHLRGDPTAAERLVVAIDRPELARATHDPA